MNTSFGGIWIPENSVRFRMQDSGSV